MNDLPLFNQEDYKKFIKKEIKKKLTKQKPLTFNGFIGWVGGKKRIAKELIALFPEHNVYVEPFMGSASIFFRKPKAKVNVLNDINSNLVNLFKVVGGSKKDFEDFIFKTFHLIKSKETFKNYIETYCSQEWNKIDYITKACIYFYINIHSFNNDIKGSAFAHNDSDINFSVYTNLFKAREKLIGTIVLNEDYKKVIKKYNKKNEKVLFFFDPPYVVADSGKYYEDTFDYYQHNQLKEQADKIYNNGNYFFITYDDIPKIRRMYQKYNIFEISFIYSSILGRNEKRTEIVITNINKGKQLELF